MPYMDDDVRARVAELVEEIETSSFRETKWGRRGYSEREVDDFLDYLVDVLFALLSASTPGYATAEPDTVLAGAEASDPTSGLAGAEPEPVPEVAPLEETELHPLPSDDTEIVEPSEPQGQAEPAPTAAEVEPDAGTGDPAPAEPEERERPLPPLVGPDG